MTALALPTRVHDIPGLVWNKAKWRIQALYELTKDDGWTYELGIKENFAAMPIVSGVRLIPPMNFYRNWIAEVDDGEQVIPENIRTAVRNKWDGYANSQLRKTKLGAYAAAQHMQKKVTTDAIGGKEVVLYKYTHDGAGFLTQSDSPTRSKESFTVGQLVINAGQKPAKLKKPDQKKLPEPVQEGEWHDVGGS